ncbi:imidazole glycerol phosphate synthase subunit HisH [bacterium K02(2017)]|nr:imidazole glycerol phosphate synthase subunit HisH [bacterium K02(2017)]
MRQKYIAIIDYGMGNLKSVSRAFTHLGAHICITRDANKINQADKIVLPGVGAFGHCINNLKQHNLIEPIKNNIQQGKLFLGICLGLQVLFESSEESPTNQGLGIIKGQVNKFTDQKLKIPHMGWNQINIKNSPKLFKNIPENSYFYFVHSYYSNPVEPIDIAASCHYQLNFCAAIEQDNIMACQFHPEKSQKWGLKILENFINMS